MSSSTPTPMPSATYTTEPSDKRLVIAGVTLGLIGLIAVSIIIYWTFHLKPPKSLPTLADRDPESLSQRTSSKQRSSSRPDSSGTPSSSKGPGLARKATTTLSNFHHRPKKSDFFSTKITPFGAPDQDEEAQKPKFIHIPGQNMRIATRLPNGAWTFSEPDVRTNRRSTGWNILDPSGSGAGGGPSSGRQSPFGFDSACGGAGYRGIDAASVSQVSPTTSSFFSHKPRFMGGSGIGGGYAGESSLSVNTQGIPRSSSPPLSADSRSQSPLITHEIPNYDLGLGPVTFSPEQETENPFETPLPTPSSIPKKTSKEEEAQYGFGEAELELDPPPPAYTMAERNRVSAQERDGWI